ncbi:MAG: DUF11 domain-containing protein, partial [Candidatus Jacksonbacteria bacterium]|nr:DUF11 domain-containing protein [Candidatus Jacksonbacteria bacterium]
SAPPNITIKKTADKTEVKTGDTITYTITYENIGKGDAKNIIITDQIPEGASYIANSATGNPAYNGATLTWTIPTLAAGEKGSVDFQARVE